MTRHAWFLAVAMFLGGSWLRAQSPCHVPPRAGFFDRMCPAGGCHPYGGGLLHWWNPRCFPRYCAPDDYWRKPLPQVCRPACPCDFSCASEVYYLPGNEPSGSRQSATEVGGPAASRD